MFIFFVKLVIKSSLSFVKWDYDYLFLNFDPLLLVKFDLRLVSTLSLMGGELFLAKDCL
jgi:hypothetical protein